MSAPGAPERESAASSRYLRQRLAVVEARVSAAVARRRAGDPDPDDRFRGLYISDADVDHLLSDARRSAGVLPPDEETAAFLAGVEAEADEAESPDGGRADLRLRRLVRSFGLDEVDLELLLIALAPDLDPRFERLYAYLHDDVSRRRASTGLALELCGGVAGGVVSRSRFNLSGALVGGGLLLVEEPERPFLTRSLRVPDRVASHLVGDDDQDPVVASLAVAWVEAELGDLDPLVRALRSGVRLCYLRERTGSAGQTLAATALERAGLPPVVVDLGRLDSGDDPRDIAASALREARLRGGGLVAGPVDVLAERSAAGVRAFSEGGAPVILTGSRGWDPSWSREVPLLFDAPVPTLAERHRIWSSALGVETGSGARLGLQGRLGPGSEPDVRDGSSPDTQPSDPHREHPKELGWADFPAASSELGSGLQDVAPELRPGSGDGARPESEPALGLDGLDAATAQFLLAPEQVVRATRAARQRAQAEGRPLGAPDLQAGARAQNAAGLERLARRIEPKVGWDDLVLPPQVIAQLDELAARARHRDQVLDVWGMGKRSSKGRGITALFAGDSGTGKTMSAEVAAGDLGLDLYVIDLSTVIDKYIGETEKNLDRIFVEADRINGVLLFDEADAIFGKRSDVKDSHDRYANVEVAYLLQRMELFDGLAILTTNLRSNVDEAFTRRLDAVIDFPVPEEEDRRRLWEKNLRPELPKADDIDLDFLAHAFRLSGGNIRNIAVAGAYLAASDGRPVGMADLIRATEREYRKLGHLCVEAEFGPYYRLIATAEPASPAGPRPVASPTSPTSPAYAQALRRLS